MKAIQFIRSGEPHGITSSPHWSYRSFPTGAESGTYYPKTEADAEFARLKNENKRLKRGLRLIGKIADSEEIGPELITELEQLRTELKSLSGGR